MGRIKETKRLIKGSNSILKTNFGISWHLVNSVTYSIGLRERMDFLSIKL